MKVVISLRAEADIQAIAEHIALDSPRAGARMGAALYDACDDLQQFPMRFAIAHELGRSDVRRQPVGDYLIFYLLREDDVLVLRVLHAARNYLKLLGGD